MQRRALRKRLNQALVEGLRPLSRLNLVEWAEANRHLSSESSAVVGPWKTRNVEVARGPMLAVTEAVNHTITVMACTQLLKTELINNTVAFYIDQDPAPILVIQPTEKLGKSWSQDRFDKMRNVTRPLREKIKDARSRDAGNTVMHKEFPGGHLTVVGANSPVDLASRPIRIVCADELDKYPPSAGREGDPLSLGEERAATFWNRKSLRCCSPTVEDISRIDMEYKAGDQRKPFVKCPHCDHAQILEWRNVRWSRDEEGRHAPDTAEYHCEGCGAAWPETLRMRLLRTEGAIEWRQTKPFRCCGQEFDPLNRNVQKGTEPVPPKWDHRGFSICPECGKAPPYDGHASFWANKLYSPWEPLGRIVRKWLAAQGDAQQLQVFVNTQLAEVWRMQGEKLEPQDLSGRVEEWNADAPVPVLVITAGVDVQGDRLEIERVGWGTGKESWSLDHLIIYGDPSTPELWEKLDDYLVTPSETRDGRFLDIAATCVDSGGHHTQAVYDFCDPRINRNVHPIKGYSRPGERRAIWPKRTSKNVPGTNNLRIIGVDAAKDMITGHLAIEDPGPGYCHFPLGRDDEYFAQLTAEKVITKYIDGFPKRVYVKNPSQRNEAFDLRVYAYAALESLNVQWGRLLANTWPDGKMPDPDAPAPKSPAAPPPAGRLAQQEQPRFRRSSRF